MAETIYINMPQSVEVTDTSVNIGKVAKIECTNQCVSNKVKSLNLIKIDNPKKKYRCIISIMKIIEEIGKEYPNARIFNVGETDCVLEYKEVKKDNTVFMTVKIIFIAVLLFFGASFAIMSFNNDISISEMFDKIFEQVMGYKKNSISILEFSYSLGLAIGIIVFYNHLGPKKLTIDPTPIEVEMRQYENQINQALIDGHNREEGKI